MRKLLILTLFISFNSNANEYCPIDIDVNEDISSWTQGFASQSLVNCQDIERPITAQNSKELLKTLAAAQKLRLGDTSNMSRHQVGEQLNNCEASPSQKALIINFEGTGSFSPRTTHLMKSFSDCIGDGNLGKSFHYHAIQAVKKAYGDNEKWSGLSAGPLNQLASTGSSQEVNWVSFASEESEILADPQNLESYSGVNSQIYPRGVYLAMSCLQTYQDSARRLGISPKIVIQGHSSGGRSSVKFLELLERLQPETKVDLMLTIDPVKEAHLAVGEVLSQIAGNANRSIYNSIPFVDDVEIKPPNVWTRRQPDTLYKPDNVSRSVNVYQNVDTDGLKGPIKFGIHGSPVHNADINQFISNDLGSDAHGEITRHERTRSIIASEYQKLNLVP